MAKQKAAFVASISKKLRGDFQNARTVQLYMTRGGDWVANVESAHRFVTDTAAVDEGSQKLGALLACLEDSPVKALPVRLSWVLA